MTAKSKLRSCLKIDRLDNSTDMRVSSFFAGIGSFDLGLERAGMNVVFQCELDPFCQQILKRHWPHVPLHDDITPSTQQLSLLLTYGAPGGRAKTSAPPTQNERDCLENEVVSTTLSIGINYQTLELCYQKINTTLMLSRASFPISITVTLHPFDDRGNLPSGVY